jgi:DNA-binding NtrC family response regulator
MTAKMAATVLPAWHKRRPASAGQAAARNRNHLFLNQFQLISPCWHRPCETYTSMTKRTETKSVLIVDDDARMLRALEKVLTGEGHTVISASWAGDAIDTLMEPKGKVDLVITDLRMPLVTGITAIHAIHLTLPDLPIIVLTAFGGADVKAECLRQGALQFLEKPLDTARLLEAVENALAHKTGPDSTKPHKAGGIFE